MKNFFKSFGMILFIVFFLGVYILLEDPELLEDIEWNPFDYARITEVDYKAVVVDEPGGDGKVIVTEQLTFEIYAASKNNLFWELWRDLPEEYIDGEKVDFKVNSVKQIFEGKEAVIYEPSPKLYWDDSDFTSKYGSYGPGKWYHSVGPYNESRRQYECVFFYVDGLYRETVVFEIEYEMTNAALRYRDSSELYITPYSESTIKYLKSFKGQILFPNEKMPEPGNYFAHTYGTNSHDFPFTESDTINPGYHTFSFELNESQLKFRPYNQYIEFSLVAYGEDKHIFTQYASENDYYYENVLSKLNEEQVKYEALPGNFIIAKVIVFIFLSAAAFLVLKYVSRLHKKIRKKYRFYKPAMQFDYFRDIPGNLDPDFAATLVFCKQKNRKDKQDGYSAIMLSLARKGYIELEKIRNTGDWESNNVKIIVKYKPVPPPPPQVVTTPQNHLFCTECGKRNTLDAKFCVHCASPILQRPIWTQTIQPPVIPVLEQLSPTEEQYFNLILRHTKGLMYNISLSSFQNKISEDYEYTDSFIKNIKNTNIAIGVKQGFFQKADYKKPAEQVRNWSLALMSFGIVIMLAGNGISYQTRLDLAFGAFFILGIGFLVTAVHLNKQAKKYILLTQFGEDEYVKWRGLYNFLNSETLMNERTVIELAIWEKYLVYATAFGISEKVVAALNIRCPEAVTSPVLRNPYYRSVHFRSGGRAFRSSVRTASFTARSGGHGGYGGGGRGGGGGGGGH